MPATADLSRPRPDASATRTVDRALDLLTAATLSSDGQTLTGLARSTGLSPATASRLLSTLVRRGLLRRGDDGAYRPGGGLMALATLVLRDEPLYELAGPHLSALAQASGETANVGVPVDADLALYLRQVTGGQRVQATAWTGRTIPRAGTSMGAALAGEVSTDGWVARRRTIEPDVTAIAAPVVGREGAIVAALTILAPSYRTGEAEIARCGRLLAEHAAELSLALGAPPSDQTHTTRRSE